MTGVNAVPVVDADEERGRSLRAQRDGSSRGAVRIQGAGPVVVRLRGRQSHFEVHDSLSLLRRQGSRPLSVAVGRVQGLMGQVRQQIARICGEGNALRPGQR